MLKHEELEQKKAPINVNIEEQKYDPYAIKEEDVKEKENENPNIKNDISVSDEDFVYKFDISNDNAVNAQIMGASALVLGEEKALKNVSEKRREEFKNSFLDCQVARTILDNSKRLKEEESKGEESVAEKSQRLEKTMLEICEMKLEDFTYTNNKDFLSRDNFVESYQKLLKAKNADNKLDELLKLYEDHPKTCKRPPEFSEDAVMDLRAKISVLKEMEQDYSEMLNIMASPYYALLSEGDLKDGMEAVDTKKLTDMIRGKNVPKAFVNYIQMLKSRKTRQDYSEGGSYFTKNTDPEAVLRYYRSRYKVNRPAAELDSAITGVISDTKLFGDGYTMKTIKEEAKKLTALFKANNKTDIIRHFNYLSTLMEQYLSNRNENSGVYADRHRKVRTLLNVIKLQKEKLSVEDPVAATKALAIENRQALEEAKKDPKGRRLVKDIEDAMAESMPASKHKFEKQQETILGAYRALIRYYSQKTTGTCIRDAAKKKRLDNLYKVKQLTLAMNRIAGYSFNKLRPDKKVMNWTDELKETIIIDQKFIDENKDVKYMPASDYGVQWQGTKWLANYLGGSSLFITGVKAKFRPDAGSDAQGEKAEQDVYLFDKFEGETLTDALEKANSLNLPLMYSDAALRQLQTIQLIDFILGQTKRSQDSFVVDYGVQSVENQDYIVIRAVAVRDHDNCLGGESFEEINKEYEDGKGISTRQMINENGYTNLVNYDFKMADKIIELDPKEIIGVFKRMGLEDKKCDLLKERIEKLQKALIKDSKDGMRATVQGYDKKASKSAQLKDLCGQHKRKMISAQSKHTYIDSALIQDSGTTHLEKYLNKDADYDLNSTWPILERIEYIKSSLPIDRQGFAGEALRDETKKVLDAIEISNNSSFSAQKIGLTNKSFIEYCEKCEPERYKKLYEKAMEKYGNQNLEEAELKRKCDSAIERGLKLKEKSLTQYLVRLKDRNQANALKLLKDRLDQIENMPEKGEYEKEEYNRLKKYYDRMLPKCKDGELQIPQKATVAYAEDAKMSPNYKFYDQKDYALFPEQPSVRDIAQGGTGNCYFLATMASIVEADPTFFYRHMKDNGDGTVTVKLYQPFSDKSVPLFIKVDKTSVFREKDGALSEVGAKGSLWVQLYEKAFAVSGLTGKFEVKEGEYDSISANISTRAFRWITGKEGTDLICIDNKKTWKDKNIFNSKFKTIDKDGKTVFSPEYDKFVKSFKKKLQDAIEGGGIITAGSYDELLESTGAGKNAEATRRGMAARHAYSVLGLESRDGKDYVRVMNPWGLRPAYFTNELTGKTVMAKADSEEMQGSFLMEMNSFVEHMDIVNYFNKSDLK